MRRVWGLFGAAVGTLAGVVLTIAVVFAAPLLPRFQGYHWLVLLVALSGPTVVGGALGLAFPDDARKLASATVKGLEAWAMAVGNRKG